MKCCAELDGTGDSGDDKYQGGSDEISARFQSQLEAVVVSQEHIGKAAPSTLGNVSPLAFRHLEAVAGRFREVEDGSGACFVSREGRRRAH